ncbi:MAG: tRNA (mo5U34)-methyltransferase [Candidatus Anoxychlamydiales bacterium]|nr:tRNA (mo5U34)-methyltransferase [Candidatus Anoxychlamydiales bacterium]
MNINLTGFSSYQDIFIEGKPLRGSGRSAKRMGLIDWKKDFLGRSVLDIGCNNGMLAIKAKLSGATRVVGLDIDPCISRAREFADELNLDVEFWQLDCESKEFRQFTQSFDIIFFCAMLSHMRDGPNMLQWIDAHCKKILYFESNSFQNFERQIGHVKKNTTFDGCKDLGFSQETQKGKDSHRLFKLIRGGRDKYLAEWDDIPITFLPIEQIRHAHLIQRLVSFKKTEPIRYRLLLESIEKHGLTTPVIVYKQVPLSTSWFKAKYSGLEGGHRFMIALELGYKEIPCKIVPVPVRK